MYTFENLQNAASFASRMRAALLFGGPADNYVVAAGAEARELEADGHVAYTLAETAKAARGEPVTEKE